MAVIFDEAQERELFLILDYISKVITNIICQIILLLINDW